MIIISSMLALLVGAALGVLGGGGSILMLPILFYVAGVEPLLAIPLSLLVVGTTSAAALLPHARSGNVIWRQGLLFGSAGMVGAYVGGRLSPLLPSWLLLTGFAVLMVVTAVAMLRGNLERPRERRAQVPRALLQGLVVGAVSVGQAFATLPVGRVDPKLLAGAALFGIGWGLGGFCPGPALVAAATGVGQAVAFCGAMLVGFWGTRALDGRIKRAPARASAIG